MDSFGTSNPGFGGDDFQSSKPKKKFPLVPVIIGASAAVLLIIVVVVVMLLGNTYKTPISIMEKGANYKYSTVEKAATAYLNGFCESEYKTVLKYFKKTGYYEDYIDERQDNRDTIKENFEDTYGEGFKVTFSIVDRDELSKKEIKAHKENIQYYFENLNYSINRLKNYSSDDWEDHFEISKSEGKELIKALEALQKAGTKFDATAGYELDCEYAIVGPDDDEDSDATIGVIKANGRWVTENTIGNAIEFITSFISYCN